MVVVWPETLRLRFRASPWMAADGPGDGFGDGFGDGAWPDSESESEPYCTKARDMVVWARAAREGWAAAGPDADDPRAVARSLPKMGPPRSPSALVPPSRKPAADGGDVAA